MGTQQYSAVSTEAQVVEEGKESRDNLADDLSTHA
jgi:hypothetical protein